TRAKPREPQLRRLHGLYGPPMGIAWAAVIVVGITGVSIWSSLFARRGAPEGSHFADGDRAAGVFGVLATGFALLSGFVVFLAFESYDTSRSGASAEPRSGAPHVERA